MRLLTATHGDIEVELRCRPAFQYAGVEHTLELSGESAAFHAASTGLPGIRLRSLSFTHNFLCNEEANLNVGEPRKSTPQDQVSWRRIMSTCKIAAEFGKQQQRVL